MKKLFISLLLTVLGCFHLGAQDDVRKIYEDFTREARNVHKEFTDTSNLVFAKAIKANWEKYTMSDAIMRQKSPEPEILPVAESLQTSFQAVPVLEAVDTIPSRWPIEKHGALWSQVKSSTREVRFFFYDAEQVVTLPVEYGSFHPSGFSESDVSAFWEKLSKYDYRSILADCTKFREQYGYNDWAVFEWVQALSSAVFPADINCEQTVFSVFLLNQMGLMTKLARAGDRLISLFSCMQPVYARKFVVLDTYPFYVARKDVPVSEVYTYSAELDIPSHPLDLRISVPPAFGGASSYKTYHKQAELFNTSFDLPVNQALIRFYDGYPQTSVSVYASAIPEARFSRALTMAVGDGISGLSEEDAVNRLLAFVQTDFRYRTDFDQFGYEKAFFCEENFVYGYNDCEDRASLFAFLVRSLLGRKVVLLEYPDHVATAVNLHEGLKGDYVRVGNDKYYVCDPSYIGATLGMTMTRFKGVPVKVYAL